MSANIEHTMSTVTTVTHRFTGVEHDVPEWPGYTNTGKPAVITAVSVSHRLTEDTLRDAEVSVSAYLLKKDGTRSDREMDTRFTVSPYGPGKDLYDALVEKFGADVKIVAEQTWQTLYG